MLIEVVEDEEHIGRLLPILDEMITGDALVTYGESPGGPLLLQPEGVDLAAASRQSAVRKNLDHWLDWMAALFHARANPPVRTKRGNAIHCSAMMRARTSNGPSNRTGG